MKCLPVEEPESRGAGSHKQLAGAEGDRAGHGFAHRVVPGQDPRGGAVRIQPKEPDRTLHAGEHVPPKGEDLLNAADPSDDPGLLAGFPGDDRVGAAIPTPLVGQAHDIGHVRILGNGRSGKLRRRHEAPASAAVQIDPGDGPIGPHIDLTVTVHGDRCEYGRLVVRLAEGLPPDPIAEGQLPLGDREDAAVRQDLDVRRSRAQPKRLGPHHDKGRGARLNDPGRRRGHGPCRGAQAESQNPGNCTNHSPVIHTKGNRLPHLGEGTGIHGVKAASRSRSLIYINGV